MALLTCLGSEATALSVQLAMDDDLFKGALGLDSDDEDAHLPPEQPDEPSRAAQRLQDAGLDSDEDDAPAPMQHSPAAKYEDPDVKHELPQTPPAPDFAAEDPDGLKGALCFPVLP